jgi:hypothetical protein
VSVRSPRRRIRSLLVLLPLAAAGWAVGTGPANAAVADEPADTWQVNGRVSAILRVGDTVYVGGSFTQISKPPRLPGSASMPRNNAAAFDARSGAPTSWNPNTNGEIFALTASPDGSTIYLGGDFTRVAGVQHVKLAAVNATNGNPVSTFNAGANALVRAMGIIDDALYVGGSFSSVSDAGLTNPVPRGALAAFDAVDQQSTDGDVLDWDPGPTSCASLGCGSGVRAMTIPNRRQIVIGGGFEAIKGTPQESIASLDPVDGNLQPWASHPSTPVLALDNDGRYVYAANKTNQAIRYLAADGQDTWRVQADGDIQALAFLDGVLYIGGHFQAVDGRAEPHAAAIIVADGDRLEWGGAADSTGGIFGMEAAGGLFIGGDFTHVSDSMVHQEGYAQYEEVVPDLPGYLFEEHFGGSLSAWDRVGKNLRIDPLSFDTGQPGATGQVGLAYASGYLRVASPVACAKASVSVIDPGANGVSLLGLRTYAGVKLAHVFVTPDRAVKFANDVTQEVFDPGVQLPTGWSTIQLCGTKGAHGHLELFVDGTRVDGDAAIDTNLGSESFGQIEIGDRKKNQTFAFSIDDVLADTQPI